MLTITGATMSALARSSCVRRMANMLVNVGTIRPDAPHDELHAMVAVLLDEGEARGIRTERLLGMYLLLRVSDEIEPFDDPGYAQILHNRHLSEPDKAHRIQMQRLARLG